jgi:acyl-CoA-binding protein
MRMRFAPGDETAYQQRRHELREQFARWLLGRPMAVDPCDADVLMDWKFGHGDGALDRWRITDVEEFLFGWCPRRLSAAPENAELVPLSVAAFVEFLDDAGLLTRMSSRPAEVRRHCEASTAEFLEEMANPTNFGLGLAAEETRIGPVSLPTPAEQLAAIRASTAMRQLRSLAEHCAAGRELTGPGDLSLDDACFLAEAIATEDVLESVESIAELPGLDRLVHLGLRAGVVERKAGRLVTAPAFAQLDEVTAYQRVVQTAVEVGLSQLSSFGGVFDGCDLVEKSVELILAELLDAGPDGVASLQLIRLVERATTADVDDEQPGILDCVDTQLESLEYLGVVTMPKAKRKVTLTPAGVPVAVALIQEAGTMSR